MSKKQKSTYILVTRNNKTEFEEKVTELLNQKNVKVELSGSLVIQGNSYYQAVKEIESKERKTPKSRIRNVIYKIITANNNQKFETEMTACLNDKEVEYEIVGSLIIQENNTFYQAVSGREYGKPLKSRVH